MDPLDVKACTTIAALKELIETRLDGMDRAVELLQAFANSQPTASAVAAQVLALEALISEKFKRLDTQIEERDIRTELSSRNLKTTIDAAFASAKEAVSEQNRANLLAASKSEAAITKQIDNILTIISTLSHGVDDKIGDIKNRITTIEGRASGLSISGAITIGIFGAVSAVATVIGVLYAVTRSNGGG